MAIYLVKRTDDVDYDEYDAVVVRATNENKARVIANTYFPSRAENSITIELVTACGKEEAILASFNAG